MSSSRFFAAWIATAIFAGTAAVVAATIVTGDTLTDLSFVAIVEGAFLGAAQGMVVKRSVGRSSGWFIATLAGVVAGRVLQYVLESSPWMAETYRWPHAMQVAAGACAGILVGAVMALPQAAALRATVRGPAVWIATRAISTATAFAFLAFAQLAIGAPDLAFPEVFGILLGVAWIAAAASAAIEASVMSRLFNLKRRPPVRLKPTLLPRGAWMRMQ
jgi:hypothetical protein